MARFGEQVIVLRAALSSARLAAVRTVRQPIECDGCQQMAQQAGLLARFARAGVDGVGKVFQAIEAAFRGKGVRRIFLLFSPATAEKYALCLQRNAKIFS